MNLISKKCFCRNLSASDRLEKNLPTVQNFLEKMKNLYLIKLVSKWKRAIRNERTSFLVFHFWDLDLVPIYSAIHSASVNLIHFFLNVGVVRRNAAKFKFSEMSFVIFSCKTGKCWNQFFLTGYEPGKIVSVK